MFIFGGKIYSLCQNNSISKKLFQNSVLNITVHCAQHIVTINNIVAVKNGMKTVVIMVIRIEQYYRAE